MGWDLSCPDWRDRIRAGRSLLPDLPIDRARATKAIGVFNKLRLPDVPGKPQFKEAAGDWQREIVGALHGSLIGGERMIREIFLLVPKKNSKTSGAAGIMETSVLMNERPNAEFLLISPTHAVSEISFRQIEGMIEVNPFLKKEMHVQPHLKKVTHLKTGTILQVRSFDPNVLTGVKPSGILLDELHLMSKISKASSIIGQLRGGLISQPEGFLIFITTQSDDVPAGAFKAELTKARMIRDGKIDGSMLPILYEFPEDIAQDREQWSDSKKWWMVTPNRDRSIKISRLEEEYQTAVDTNEEELRRWASQHLNIEIGIGLHSDRWAGADHWEASADKSLGLDQILERSDCAVIGIDGGGLDDLLGLAVLGREKQTRRWLLWSHAWAHQTVLERRKDIAARLRDFERDGDLTIVKEVGQDIQEVVDIVEKVRNSDLMPEKGAVGVDPWGIVEVIDELAVRNITLESGQVAGIKQGWTLTNWIKTTERQLASGSLVHHGSALMNWCVGNARVEARGNAISITKAISGSAKIDPLMALFDAAFLMGQNPLASSTIYEDREIRFVG